MGTTGSENSFATCYIELCRQQRLRPLPMICVTLPHSLDFTTDRVKMDDWTPILNSLSLDRTLRSISVRSKYQHRKLLEHANSESKARACGKAPVVLTRFLLEWLLHSLAQCVRNSSALTSLELEGIPVPPDCLAVLCVGLASTKSLQHLSLQRCYIGDAGCELVCRTIADVQSIRSLNLSQCDLTSGSGPSLGSALSRQKLSLYHDAWMQSLRYREPKLESMPGLRRLTLNGNTKLGNEAVTGLIEAIRDSLWFKALDMQQCGLTDEVGKEILELLEHNKTLVIVDVRLNSGLREETLNEITRRLERNELHSKSEYRWLGLPQQKDHASKRVSSAGNLQKQKQAEQETNKATLTRPRSAIFRQVKRPPAPIAYRKPSIVPMPQMARRIKMKPPVPVVERRSRQPMKPPENARVAAQPATVPKVSLHLDLQAQISSLAEQAQTDVAKAPDEPTAPPSGKSRSTEMEVTPEQESEKLREVLEQLSELRADRDRLQEEIRSIELSLAEERARREFAEAKLRSTSDDLVELEEVVRQQDRDSQGYLLVSQKSMEDICLSFSRLLEIIEANKRPGDSIARLDATDSEESSVVKEDIKRQFAMIMRKTKSENLKRGYFVDEKTVVSRIQLAARYGRSEGNIRSSIEPLASPLRLERNIGDTGENLALPRLLPNFRPEQRLADARLSTPRKASGDASPGDRVRTLFASIVNGDAVLGINSHRR